jgi:hypothetical protein
LVISKKPSWEEPVGICSGSKLGFIIKLVGCGNIRSIE